jgi:hypothetical protein
MPTQVLGSHNFLEAPTVNNDQVISSIGGSVPSISSGLFAAIPTPALNGRLYLATDTGIIYRDNGAAWIAEIYGSLPILRQNMSGVIPAISGTTIIPQDNTAPLITEGTQVWTQSVTPSYVGSKVQISFTATVDSGTNNRMIIASVFRDTVNIGVTTCTITTSARPQCLAFNLFDIPGGAGPYTYSCRVGVSSAATWYVNGNGVAQYAGLKADNSYFIQEF